MSLLVVKFLQQVGVWHENRKGQKHFKNEQGKNLQLHLLQSLMQLFNLGLCCLESGHQLGANTRNDRVNAYGYTGINNITTTSTTYNNTNDDDDEEKGAHCLYL